MVSLIENIRERFNLSSTREDSAQLLRLIEKRNPDVAKITPLIENGHIDLNEGTDSSPPPLIAALLGASRVRSGESPSGRHIAIAHALIDTGANVSDQRTYMTANGVQAARPLDLAVHLGDASLVAKLVAHGADPGRQAEWGINLYDPPILQAIESGNIAVTRILIEASADINEGFRVHASTTHTTTALEKALRLSEESPQAGTEITKMLLDAGADAKSILYAYGDVANADDGIAFRRAAPAVRQLLLDSIKPATVSAPAKAANTAAPVTPIQLRRDPKIKPPGS